LRRCAQLTHASFKFPESPCSCDLPSKKRPIRDSLSALKPPQYKTGRLDGSESICCHVSRAPRLLAWELLWSMCVFTICNTDWFCLRVLKHIGGGTRKIAPDDIQFCILKCNPKHPEFKPHTA
jgi:hypothetical protein